MTDHSHTQDLQSWPTALTPTNGEATHNAPTKQTKCKPNEDANADEIKE
jgi:hypothetical protein